MQKYSRHFPELPKFPKLPKFSKLPNFPKLPNNFECRILNFELKNVTLHPNMLF